MGQSWHMLRMPPSIWHYRNSRKLVQIYLALREFGNWDFGDSWTSASSSNRRCVPTNK